MKQAIDNCNRKEYNRDSKIELLKVFAILSIVIAHAIPVDYSRVGAIDIFSPTDDWWRFLLDVISFSGQFSNDIFLICSTWFLLDSHKVKRVKVELLLTENLLFSVLFLLTFLLAGIEIPFAYIVKQFFPTTMEYYWFIGCYILLYLIHPYLNLIVENCSQKRLLVLDIGMTFLYCIAGMIKSNLYYRTDFVGFISIYLIIAYVKKYVYGKNINWKKYFIRLTLINILIITMLNISSLKCGVPYSPFMGWRMFTNPLLIAIAVSLFLVVFNAPDMKYNRIINFVSSLSMYVFIIHRNVLVKDYFQHVLFDRWSQYYTSTFMQLIIVLGYGVFSFVISLTIAGIYKLLFYSKIK